MVRFVELNVRAPMEMLDDTRLARTTNLGMNLSGDLVG